MDHRHAVVKTIRLASGSPIDLQWVERASNEQQITPISHPRVRPVSFRIP